MDQNLVAVLAALVVWLLIHFLLGRRRNRPPVVSKTDDDLRSDDQNEAQDYDSPLVAVDINQIFLAEADIDPEQATVDLVKVYNPQDVMFIRSLLYSASILTYVDSSAMNNLFPGLTMKGLTDLTIRVFAKDQQEATVLVTEYIQSLKSSHRAAISQDQVSNSLAHILPELLAHPQGGTNHDA